MTRNGGKNRDQIEFTSLDELAPEDRLVRKLENAIDWSFIYEMVEDSYCEDNGRPSLDPVILINPPYSLTFSIHFELHYRIFQHLRSKPDSGLSQKRVCLRSAARSMGAGRVFISVIRKNT